MKMNEKWKTYWTSDITEDDCNIVSIEKIMTSIYINTMLMKMSLKTAWRLYITFIKSIWTSQVRNQLNKNWLIELQQWEHY